MNLMMLFIGDFTYPTRVLKPLLKLELDKFPNYDDILIELEQLRNLLENY